MMLYISSETVIMYPRYSSVK